MHAILWLGNTKGGVCLEDLDVDGKLSRMYLGAIWWDGVNWIHLAQDMEQLQSCKHDNEHLDFIKDEKFLD
jgi:hypothetical protein